MRIYTEEHHEHPEEEMMRLIREELSDHDPLSNITTDSVGCPTTPVESDGEVRCGRLGRLTHYKKTGRGHHIVPGLG